ncbi:diguanylate cyclase (GGDEF) domain-containing protein [Paramicrobacterium humi]|uniref:Diguanylate cyclase (GGDEF) domain-containing protein n=1 Tax=Paramicrobacterium humi TaxID=640635 RepID=A0A1H4NAW7_9MICO|nr:GGDEF domain-containing protein [Microbacterium humi]SEB92406.1 diguanylate cyclase (GGDEF) domain-containing protein [Microbacterium humi]
MIDTTTVLVMSGLLTIVCTVIFVMNTVFGRLDGVGMYWSAALTFGIVSSLAFAVYGASDDIWWANAVGNPTIVAAMGCIWLGIRTFNGRRSLVWAVYAVAAIVFVATLVDAPADNEWAGAPVSWIGIAGFTLLAAAECFTRRLRHRINGYVLLAATGIEALFYIVRLIVFYTVGADSELFLVWFGTAATTGLTMLLVVAGTLAISMLRIERANEMLESGAYGEIGFSIEGLLDWSHFLRGGADRMKRAGAHGMSSGLVLVSIDSLSEINTAFGREVGDRAVKLLASVLRDTMPPTSIIARETGGKFGVVTTMVDPLEAEATLAGLQNALVERAVDADGGLRLTISVGVATTWVEAPDWDEMYAIASARRAEAVANGGNLVVDGRV